MLDSNPQEDVEVITLRQMLTDRSSERQRVTKIAYAKLGVAHTNWVVADGGRREKEKRKEARQVRNEEYLRKAHGLIAEEKEEKDQEAVALRHQLNIDTYRTMRGEEQDRMEERDRVRGRFLEEKRAETARARLVDARLDVQEAKTARQLHDQSRKDRKERQEALSSVRGSVSARNKQLNQATREARGGIQRSVQSANETRRQEGASAKRHTEELQRMRETNIHTELEMLRVQKAAQVAAKTKAKEEREEALRARQAAARVERDNDVIARNVRTARMQSNRAERNQVYRGRFVNVDINKLGEGAKGFSRFYFSAPTAEELAGENAEFREQRISFEHHPKVR